MVSPQRRRRADRQRASSPIAGIGHTVDVDGQEAFDPTQNVINLVKALEVALAEFRTGDIKYVDTQLNAAEKLQNYARGAESRLHTMELAAETRLRDALRNADTALAAAETRRIDQLAQTRQEFQNTIRDMLAESVRTTSTLVSTQLVQIQATFDTRVSKLEAGAFTQAGKSSVADPQIADAMARIPQSIAVLATTTAETLAKMVSTNAEAQEKAAKQNAEAINELAKSLRTVERSEAGTTARGMGRGEIVSYIMMGILVLSQAVTIYSVIHHP